MNRSFPTRDEAVRFVATHTAGTVRFVGGCAGCGKGVAESVPGRWEISSDLFGKSTAYLVPVGRPTGDPCGHGAIRWEQVRIVAGVYEACNEGCRDALGGSCSCSCLGRSHGANHRIKSSSPT